MKYRAEIDGLRALAVVPVILFHAGFELFSGGYLGVDIFFVISGYLISSIIFSEVENNNFSIIEFYVRRTKRIVPLLLFVIFVFFFVFWDGYPYCRNNVHLKLNSNLKLCLGTQ